MFGFLKNNIYPIGVDMGDDGLKMAQLEENGTGVSLIAGGSQGCPVDVKPGSTEWQLWAIKAVSELKASEKFRGKDIIATIPQSEVFIDHVKLSRVNKEKYEDTIFSRIKQKLPFDRADAMIRYIPTEDDMVVSIASQRQKIDRHLAIYEKANLKIRSLGVWPLALISSYVRFFGRRQNDLQATVCLLGMETNHTNLVICRHKKLLFARSLDVGVSQLCQDKTSDSVEKIISELTACKRLFSSMYKQVELQRLVFLSGSLPNDMDKNVCSAIAKELCMPAQIGDCLEAVNISTGSSNDGSGIDRRQYQFGWDTSFGLSLS